MKSAQIAVKRGIASPFGPSFGGGGRSSNSGFTATVFGGNGFVGRYLVHQLGVSGTRVYVPYRGDDMEVRHLKPSFDLGQLGLIPFSIRDEETIRKSLRNSDVVINCIGKHYETKHFVPTRRSDGSLSRVNYSFEDVHVKGAATLARIAKEEGVKGFIHVSSLTADANSPSHWSRSKAMGEDSVKAEFSDAIIVKLASVFGHEDRFLNWIAQGTKSLPFFPLIDGGRTKVQPVFVEDVATGLHAIIKRYDEFSGKTFQFAGPAEYSHKEIAEFVQDVIMTKKPLVDIPIEVAQLVSKVTGHFISPFFTEDMLRQMQQDAVANPSQNLLGFNDLNVETSSMDRVAFDYLHRFRTGGHFVLAQGYH